MVRVEHVMGTVVSLHLRDPGIADAAVDGVFGWFHEVDARFSTYREDSEVSRLGRGALGVGESSDDVREVLALCDDVHRESEGIFEVWGRRHGPPFDPSALVKGWSVDRAAAMLEGAGARNFYLNAGGDVVGRGGAQPGRGWRV
ncbi:MAG: FAD:protein FMN transferase, partial [Candidatus Dormibacteraeota bacterium]|nr:FAD:protein FMN transferase [Candidatus Dormibacteraeota bacterium]